MDITVKGNLGADPEIKTLDTGTKVCNMRVYVPVLTRTDDKLVDTYGYWSDVSAYGKLAEHAKILKKGMPVILVADQVYPQSYTKKTGEAGTSVKMRAASIGVEVSRITELTMKPPALHHSTKLETVKDSDEKPDAD